jgi:hypothetical protein
VGAGPFWFFFFFFFFVVNVVYVNMTFSERHHRGVVGGWVWLLGLVVFVLELFRIHCVLNVMISLLFLFFVLCEEMLS